MRQNLPQQIGRRLRQANRILHRALHAHGLAGGGNQENCGNDGLCLIRSLHHLRSHRRRDAGIHVHHIRIGNARAQLALQGASRI